MGMSARPLTQLNNPNNMDYLIVPIGTSDNIVAPKVWVDIDIIDDTGRPAWVFSDGPVGERSGSRLYNTFEEGAADHQGYIFIIR